MKISQFRKTFKRGKEKKKKKYKGIQNKFENKRTKSYSVKLGLPAESNWDAIPMQIAPFFLPTKFPHPGTDRNSTP